MFGANIETHSMGVFKGGAMRYTSERFCVGVTNDPFF
jgi:hypothetical protein